MRLLPQATGRNRLVSFIGSWHGTHDGTMGLSAHPSLTGVIGGANVIKAPYPDPYHPPFLGDDGESDRPVPRTTWSTTCSGPSASRRTSPPSSSRRCRATAATSCRRPTSCRSCGRSATATASCSSSTRSRSGWPAPAACSPSSTAGSRPTSSCSASRSAAACPSARSSPGARSSTPAPAIALFTASGNATGCAAGLAVLDEIERLDLVRALGGEWALPARVPGRRRSASSRSSATSAAWA